MHQPPAPAAQPPRQLTLLARRTMGVAALADGELEYMLMRRIVTGSDNQGPWPLDDKLPMEDHVQLVLGPAVTSEPARFPAALALEHPLALLYRNDSTPAGPAPVVGEGYRNLAEGTPPSVWAELMVRVGEHLPANATYAIRLQNTVAGGVAVAVPSLAAAFGIVGMHTCVETTLSLQQTRAANEAARLRWKQEAGVGSEATAHTLPAVYVSCTGTTIMLESLDIRTFTFGVGKQP